MGAALDCLLTSPERWDTDFAVVDASRPFGLMGKFVDCLPSGLTEESELSNYQEAYDKSGYKMWMDKVVAKFWSNEEYVKYYKLTRDLGDNIIVLSSDENDAVVKAHELIMANEFVRGYFVNEDVVRYTLMHQVPIYFQYTIEGERSESCKALLDGIKIDHELKTIQPFDLKTTRSVYDFPSHFVQYGYYIQCAFYLEALKSAESPVKDLLDNSYQLLPFIFIAVENKKSSSHPAIIYEPTDRDIRCGLLGGFIKGRYYKGVNELILDYWYHLDTNYWDLPADLVKTKGVMKMHIFDE